MAVEHDRLGARRGPTSSPRRRAVAAIAVERIAVPALLDGDRGAHATRRPGRGAASASPRRVATSVAATDDDSHGPGSGSRPISSASTTTSSMPRPGAAVRLGHEHARPPQLGQLAPQLVGEAAVVVEHRPHVASAADLAVEEGARGVAQRLLLLAEREVHGAAALGDADC